MEEFRKKATGNYIYICECVCHDAEIKVKSIEQFLTVKWTLSWIIVVVAVLLLFYPAGPQNVRPSFDW